MSVEERIQIDIDYSNRQGFKTDLRILAEAFRSLDSKNNV